MDVMDGPPLIPFGPNANCTLDTCPLEWSVLQYLPSLGANIAFIAIFVALMFAHTVLGVLWKSWWFLGCMAVGCLTEVLGYGGRIMLYYNPFSFAGFMMQIICIGCAPVFYSAAIYVMMSKIVENLDPSLSRVKPKLYYIIFITSDVFSLTLQAVGGGMSTSTSGSSQSAVDLTLTGLSFQVFSMVVFCSLLADYMIRYSKTRSITSMRLKIFLIFLSISILLILARCGYRVAELSDGYFGALIHNEPLFIALDGVLIALAVLTLCIGHPGLVFSPSKTGLRASDASSQDGIMLQNK
ncbi:RTA1-domain-containing protein [Hypoxylon sp. FL1857]|nr:RTA1-domain-containing protein [Hypoxylon sp. FL1857]